MEAAPRDVGFALFDFLHMEMVRTFTELSEEKEQVHIKLEKIGFSVGQCIAERHTRDMPRLSDQLEVIKFICKDFWICVFHKQVDNLRTNHRGVYVLQDNKFTPFVAIAQGTQYLDNISPFLALPCGMIRGALAALGFAATVHADVVNIPACTFQIRVQRMEVFG